MNRSMRPRRRWRRVTGPQTRRDSNQLHMMRYSINQGNNWAKMNKLKQMGRNGNLKWAADSKIMAISTRMDKMSNKIMSRDHHKISRS